MIITRDPEEFLRRNHHELCRIVRHKCGSHLSDEIVEDKVSELYLYICKTGMLNKFDPSRGSFEAWICTAMYWPMRNEAKKARHRNEQLITNDAADNNPTNTEYDNLKERLLSYQQYIEKHAGINVAQALQMLYRKAVGESTYGCTGMIIYNSMLKDFLEAESL
jgi:DNA-directed RNA polymerase specialized sigma24 family protein